MTYTLQQIRQEQTIWFLLVVGQWSGHALTVNLRTLTGYIPVAQCCAPGTGTVAYQVPATWNNTFGRARDYCSRVNWPDIKFLKLCAAIFSKPANKSKIFQFLFWEQQGIDKIWIYRLTHILQLLVTCFVFLMESYYYLSDIWGLWSQTSIYASLSSNIILPLNLALTPAAPVVMLIGPFPTHFE